MADAVWKYQGSGEYVPGVPARDLTEEEHAEHVEAGRLPVGSKRAKLYKKDTPKPARKEGD